MSARCWNWSWIVGGLIVAAALIGGAFIIRTSHARAAAPSVVTFAARVAGISASIDVVLAGAANEAGQ